MLCGLWAQIFETLKEIFISQKYLYSSKHSSEDPPATTINTYYQKMPMRTENIFYTDGGEYKLIQVSVKVGGRVRFNVPLNTL